MLTRQVFLSPMSPTSTQTYINKNIMAVRQAQLLHISHKSLSNQIVTPYPPAPKVLNQVLILPTMLLIYLQPRHHCLFSNVLIFACVSRKVKVSHYYFLGIYFIIKMTEYPTNFIKTLDNFINLSSFFFKSYDNFLFIDPIFVYDF